MQDNTTIVITRQSDKMIYSMTEPLNLCEKHPDLQTWGQIVLQPRFQSFNLIITAITKSRSMVNDYNRFQPVRIISNQKYLLMSCNSCRLKKFTFN